MGVAATHALQTTGGWVGVSCTGEWAEGQPWQAVVVEAKDVEEEEEE